MRMTMTDMADAADAVPGAFRLENADTLVTLPQHVLEATRSAAGADEFNSYLPLRGLAECRAAIAERYQADNGLAYDPDREIVVTSGAGEALLNALLALIDPGDKVMITNPTYSGMAQRVRLAGGIQSFADLRADGSRWRLDPEAARRAAAGAKAIFYASPCMPTGTVFTNEETALLASLAAENDAWLIFNGHADKVAFDGRSVINPAALPGMQERTVLVGCMSKNYGMPGWRIGWNAGPREVLGPLEDTHIFNGCMASGFTQAGAIAALRGPQQWQRDLVGLLQRRRDVLLDELAAAPEIKVIAPEGGLYFLADVSALGLEAAEFCARLLAEWQVALTPMPGWGADDFGRYAVRLIFSNEPEERLREAGRHIVAFAHSLVDEAART
jgi:aspartate/methionine/tyrosine aminotransferase